MNYKFHPEAKREVLAATQHYQKIHKRLGKDFRKEVEESISRILLTPKAWHAIEIKYRRCLLKRFPFGIIYEVNEMEGVCFIFAVMHLHRKPYYWKDRKF